MKPSKVGQIVKFSNPMSDEDPNQLYVIIEIIDDDVRPRSQIRALGTGLSFPPINMVKTNDLVVVQNYDISY